MMSLKAYISLTFNSQFKLILVITPFHIFETDETVPITTLAYGGKSLLVYSNVIAHHKCLVGY